MSPDESYRNLIAGLRAGDADAAEKLVRRYEDQIRRVIRVRLGPQLRRAVDSVDVCQSVLAKFFVCAAAGQFDLQRPDQLIRVLVTMARNHITDRARWENAERRDRRRETDADSVVLREVANAEATPSRIVASRDLLERMRSLLTEAERRVADLRAQGLEWGEIAQALGEKPDAVRKRLQRGLERVLPELGLEEGGLEPEAEAE